MNNLRVNESMYLSDLVILKCIKERLKELSLDEDFLSMKKYIQHPIHWVLKNKWRSMTGKPVCIDKKWYDVGQDPEQGNLKEKSK